MDGIRCHKYIIIIITVQRLLLEKETEDFRFFTNLKILSEGFWNRYFKVN